LSSFTKIVRKHGRGHQKILVSLFNWLFEERDCVFMANANAFLLTPAIFASGVALVLAAVLYAIQVGGRSEGSARRGAHDF
jgi:hypothetical protein